MMDGLNNYFFVVCLLLCIISLPIGLVRILLETVCDLLCFVPEAINERFISMLIYRCAYSTEDDELKRNL